MSADPSLHEECFRGAKFLLRLLEGMGAEVKLCQPVEDKNPVVLARIGRDPAKPTVTLYGGPGLGMGWCSGLGWLSRAGSGRWCERVGGWVGGRVVGCG